MRTQQWSISEFQRIDRETRQIITESGEKYTLGSKALIYLSREAGGRGPKSVENAS